MECEKFLSGRCGSFVVESPITSRNGPPPIPPEIKIADLPGSREGQLQTFCKIDLQLLHTLTIIIDR